MKAFSTMVLLALLAATLMVLAGEMPDPSVSEYFNTTGGGFTISEQKLIYAVYLKPRKLINGSKPWFARIEFDNPEDRKSPFVQLLDLPATEDEFSVHSEKFSAIKTHKTYKVILKAYQDSERTVLITTHEQGVRFDVPSDMAKKWGIKLL